MKRRYLAALLLSLPLLMAAGIPNFFAGLIGDNVQDYCLMSSDEQVVMMHSVNRYTGTHRVMISCGEILAEADRPTKASRNRRIAR